MGIVKSLEKRINWALNVSYDKSVGFFRYNRLDGKVFIRHPRHYETEKDTQWLCDNLYYHYYIPRDGDVVVELGAGYGEEAVYLQSKSPDVKFFGVEIQPVIFECLSNTLHSLGENFTCTSTAISNDREMLISSQFSYTNVGNVPGYGYMNIPCMTWESYIKKQGIVEIDLLKMNIEGAEKDILTSIKDFSIIKRFNISCHDFRANNNEGEYYRSKQQVLKVLKDNNYIIKTYELGYDWSDDWIYAEQKNV